ncbi:MAG: TRZ/ATZ family hydrolase [Gammaproteobacteria bacterium]|nr:TRZ/ATZ family hydrolase [Gammaproteobacteria bacterium]
MKQVDQLLHARWIVTVNEHNDLFEYHTLVVDQSKIIDILPTELAKQSYRAHQVDDLGEQLLMPGLINAHTHLAMNLLRGFADDLPLMEWLEQQIWPAEGRWVDEQFVADGSELAMAELIRSGTTCFNDMYFFPEITAQVAQKAGLRASIGLMMIDFPTAWGSGPEEYLQKGLALQQKYQDHPLIRTAFAPHATYTVSDVPLLQLKQAAQQHNSAIHIHLHETAGEIALHEKQHGCRPLARLDKLGMLNANLQAVHMTQLSDEEIQQLADNGVQVIHCPESNLKLASGFAPIARLLAAGVNVALGTDGAASNNDLDLFAEMRTAALLAKGVAGDASVVPTTTALRMATINGAKALGIADQTGSLEVGKAADVIAIDLNTIETQPLYDPVSQLVYASSRNQITHLWVAGKQLLKERQLTTLDETQIIKKAQLWQKKIGGQ